MTKSVYKYTLVPTDTQVVRMPASAKILSVANQDDCIRVWAEVNPDPDVRVVHRVFHIFGTGHQMPEAPGIFVGTVLMCGGQLVFHVYVDPE